jgi:hypothetical protein
MPQALADYAKKDYYLLLFFRLGPEALLPALLQMLQADVAYALIRPFGVAEVVDGGLYGKEQRSSTGT